MVTGVECGGKLGPTLHPEEAPVPEADPYTNPLPGTNNGSNSYDTDPLRGLPTGSLQRDQLCQRGHQDPISLVFCTPPTAPQVASMKGLLTLLGLQFQPGVLDNAANGNPGFTLSGHSTAISTRHTNPINPRAFVFTPPVGGVRFPPSGTPNPTFVGASYTRGEPFVELVSKDPGANGELRFFLFKFQRACSLSSTCDNADLFQESAEGGFVDYTLYDDEDLKDTVMDCRQCHQPQGPGTPKMLRMQELVEGWMHWFYKPRNADIIRMFLSAHEGESYGGIPSEILTSSNLVDLKSRAAPEALEQLIRNNGFGKQPNEFPTREITIEQGRNTNTIWETLYEEAVQGRAIAVPYFKSDITDPRKVTSAVSVYRSAVQGILPRDQTPDMRDVLLDSALPYMSFQPKPGLDGKGILVHMCQHCHNSSLDQTTNRARFNVERLSQMSESEKLEAVRRLRLPDDHARKMPPVRFHSLSSAEIVLATGELSK